MVHFNNSLILILNRFGQSGNDEISILAPIQQCCMIRSSTLQRLLNFHNRSFDNRRLSDLMRSSLNRDPLAPILNEKHLLALDRRIAIILDTIRECTQYRNSNKIIFFDTELQNQLKDKQSPSTKNGKKQHIDPNLNRILSDAQILTNEL